MASLFDPATRISILDRLDALSEACGRHWGKMNAAQMLAHCAAALEVGTGDRKRKQVFIGKVFAPFVKPALLGEKPFGKNSPTDPTFIVSDDRNFTREKQRLVSIVSRFCEGGPAEAGKHTHSFLGRITGDEWGVMMYKHLDHHLRQFGG
jgi:hypothetical protein